MLSRKRFSVGLPGLTADPVYKNPLPADITDRKSGVLLPPIEQGALVRAVLTA
jgi:hypothetical protein